MLPFCSCQDVTPALPEQHKPAGTSGEEGLLGAVNEGQANRNQEADMSSPPASGSVPMRVPAAEQRPERGSASSEVPGDSDDDDSEDGDEDGDDDDWDSSARRRNFREPARGPTTRERSAASRQPQQQHIPSLLSPQLRQPTPPPSPPPELSFPLPDTPKQSPPSPDVPQARRSPSSSSSGSSSGGSRSSSPEPQRSGHAERRPGPLTLLARKMESEGAFSGGGWHGTDGEADRQESNSSSATSFPGRGPPESLVSATTHTSNTAEHVPFPIMPGTNQGVTGAHSAHIRVPESTLEPTVPDERVREMESDLERQEKLRKRRQERTTAEERERALALEREREQALERERFEQQQALEKEEREKALQKEKELALEKERQEREQALAKEREEQMRALELERQAELQRLKLLEQERLQREREEREKREREEMERAALARERERLERERALEAERQEKERIEREEALERERLEKEKALEQERIEREKALEQERIERKKVLEQERIEREKALELERLEREKALELERREREKALELERLEREKALELERRERERLEREKALERERIEREKALERERVEKERAERRAALEQERIEKERKEKLERERALQQEELERARKEMERALEQEREKALEHERLENEKAVQKEKEERERKLELEKDKTGVAEKESESHLSPSKCGLEAGLTPLPTPHPLSTGPAINSSAEAGDREQIHAPEPQSEGQAAECSATISTTSLSPHSSFKKFRFVMDRAQPSSTSMVIKRPRTFSDSPQPRTSPVTSPTTVGKGQSEGHRPSVKKEDSELRTNQQVAAAPPGSVRIQSEEDTAVITEMGPKEERATRLVLDDKEQAASGKTEQAAKESIKKVKEADESKGLSSSVSGAEQRGRDSKKERIRTRQRSSSDSSSSESDSGSSSSQSSGSSSSSQEKKNSTSRVTKVRINDLSLFGINAKLY